MPQRGQNAWEHGGFGAGDINHDVIGKGLLHG